MFNQAKYSEIFWAGLLAIGLIGCGDSGEFREVTEGDLEPKEEHEHHHAHEAPHGGILAELGDHEYNAELVFADSDPKLTVYILGAHAETPVAAKADSLVLTDESGEVTLVPAPQEGDEEGTASKFVLEGSLPEGLTAESLHGDLKVTIKGKEYSAHVHGGDAHDHEGEGHDHEHSEEEHDHEEESAEKTDASGEQN